MCNSLAEGGAELTYPVAAPFSFAPRPTAWTPASPSRVLTFVSSQMFAAAVGIFFHVRNELIL